MKSISKLLLGPALIASVIGFNPTQAHAHRGGNGGNSIASHFSAIARNVHMIWSDICINEKDPEAFCNYVKDFGGLLNKESKTYVVIKGESDPNKVRAFDGEIREAINYVNPDEIIINEQAWKDMESSPNVYSRRINLVLHEYLTFIGLDRSDFYDYSAAVFGMLVRKGYDLSKLTRVEGLPTPCSLVINSKSSREIENRLQHGLMRKGYLVKRATEKTRFVMNVTTTCKDRPGSNTCALHVQVNDSYTDAVTFSELAIESGIFTKKDTVFNKLTDTILEKVGEISCR
jgi:hypothetical protein